MSAPVPRAVIAIIGAWGTVSEFFHNWGIWHGEWWANLWESIVVKGAERWVGFLGFWIKLGNAIGAFWVDKWTAIGAWWATLTTGIGEFWGSVWNGMKSIGLGVYNWIIDRLNSAISLINAAISLYNRSLGRLTGGIGLLQEGMFQHGTIGAAITAPTAPTFTAPVFAQGGGANPVFIIQIGDKRLAEIIVDTLTGEVRQKELSE